MSYLFRGFFLRASDGVQPLRVIEAVQRCWFSARIRPVGQPFPGIAVQLADRPPDVFDADAEELEAEISQWSKHFPQALLVFIDVECVGGKCLYQGYICKDGHILLREDTEEEGPEPLRRLLRFIGVELDERGYFAPFERSFFEDQQISLPPSQVSMEYRRQHSLM
jgi:hypothetical protein